MCKSYRNDYHKPPTQKPTATCPYKWAPVGDKCYMVSKT